LDSFASTQRSAQRPDLGLLGPRLLTVPPVGNASLARLLATAHTPMGHLHSCRAACARGARRHQSPLSLSWPRRRLISSTSAAERSSPATDPSKPAAHARRTHLLQVPFSERCPSGLPAPRKPEIAGSLRMIRGIGAVVLCAPTRRSGMPSKGSVGVRAEDAVAVGDEVLEVTRERSAQLVGRVDESVAAVRIQLCDVVESVGACGTTNIGDSASPPWWLQTRKPQATQRSKMNWHSSLVKVACQIPPPNANPCRGAAVAFTPCRDRRIRSSGDS
jgi:hypothetical protein